MAHSASNVDMGPVADTLLACSTVIDMMDSIDLEDVVRMARTAHMDMWDNAFDGDYAGRELIIAGPMFVGAAEVADNGMYVETVAVLRHLKKTRTHRTYREYEWGKKTN